MPSRFGVKDALMLLAMLALAALVWASMVQSDRAWNRVLALESSIDELNNRIAAMTLAPLEATAPEVPWARDGVPITYPKRGVEFVTPPGHPSGEFVEVLEGAPRTITPYVYADSFAERVLEDRVTQALADFDPDTTELRGVLASAWQMDPDGLWLRVKIDPRARFSDGEPVTAGDVIYTFDEILNNPLVNAPRFRGTFDAIESVREVTETSVEFTFREPMFNNLTLALRFPILPAHVYERYTPEQLNSSTALAFGSGPYRVADTSWSPGSASDLVLERNENYWASPPAFEQVRFPVITDSAARYTAYKDGAINMYRPSPAQFAELMNAIPIHAVEVKPFGLEWQVYSSGYTYIAWRCGERNGSLTPFADARVRRAMTLLLDRDRVLRDFYNDLGTVSTGPFSPVTPQSDGTITPHPFDVDGAMVLLAQAGWQDRDGDGYLENDEGVPFTFEFTYPRGSSSSPKIASYLKDQCASVGIRMEERVLDFAVFLEARDSGDFDALTLAQGVGFPETDPQPSWHSESEGNFTGFSSERADELIERGRRELDDENRMAIWHELHRVIHEEQPCTFLIDRAELRFVAPGYPGIRATATGLDFSRPFAVNTEPASP
ncbi:MAG: ABC transporter substrate-binding protein [Phycisphaerales bacterium]